MSVTNNKVTTPIGVYEVAMLLGVKTTDVGTVCASNNINKWAKYKPIKCQSLSFDTDDGNSGTRFTDAEKARKADLYGFATEPLDSPSLASTPMISFTGNVMDNVSSQFDYVHPSGGANNQLYRLADFNKYNHAAVMGFSIDLATMYYNNLNGLVMYFGLSNVTGFDSTSCLTPQDIMSEHSDKIVGVLFSSPADSYKYFVSSGKTLSELKNNVYACLFSGETVSGSDPSQYAVVPPLADSWKGESVTAAVVLAPNTISGITTEHAVIDFGSYYTNCYSLEFTENLDRKTIVSSADTSGIDMTKLTITNASSMSFASGTITQESLLWYYYNNLAGFALDVSAASDWMGGTKTLYYTLKLESFNSFFVADKDSLDGEVFTDSGSFTIEAGATHTIGHAFAAAVAVKSVSYNKKADFAATLTLSTEEGGEGLTKVYSTTITLATWS